MSKEIDRGVWLAVLAILGLIAYPHAGTELSKASAASDKGALPAVAASAAETAPVRSVPQPSAAEAKLVHALARSLGDIDPAYRAPAAPPGSEWTAEALGAAVREQRPLEVLVAGVPDPRLSRMALFLDQALSALSLALGRHGYQQDRFVLPWKTAAVTQGDDEARAPGIVLFRRERALLVAFLVTESPVLGASAEEAQAALAVADKFVPAERTLAVVAPFFSGSMHAWRDAFQGLAARGRETVMVSGTATAPTQSLLGTPPPSFEFLRTIVTDDALDRYFTEQICSIDPAARVATLTESGSGYGAQLATSGTRQQAQAQAGTRACEQIVDAFRFPLHISEVRAAHERSSSKDPAPGPRRLLDLKLEPAEGNEPDMPESFSSLTPYDEELALGQELTRICRDGVKYLRIAATDPIDVEFLAREARKFCPDLTLATFGWDMIYTHPDLGPTLTGMLIVTSYPPLFPFRDLADREARFPFASYVAEGFHNAVRCAVQRTDPSAGDAWRATCKPPGDIWLAELRRGTLWPLVSKRLEPVPAGATHGTPVAEQERHPPRPQPLTRLLTLLLIGFAVAHALARVREPGKYPSALTRLFARVPSRYVAPQAVVLGVADLSLASITLAVLPLLCRLTFVPSHGWLWRGGCWTLLVLGGVTTATLFIAGGAALLRAVREYRARRPVIGALGVGLIPVAVLVVLGCGLAWSADYSHFTATRRAYFMLRATEPFGMSPLAPVELCLAGVYLWALFSLQRVKTLASFSRLLPSSGQSLTWRPYQQAARALAGVAHDRSFRNAHPLTVVIVLWLGVTAFYARAHLRPTFEGKSYDWAFTGAFLTLYALVAFGLGRFVLLSRALLKLLQSLSAEPMLDAYVRIASKVSGSFGLQLRARVAPVEEYVIAVDTCRSLATLAAGMAAGDARDPRSSRGIIAAQAEFLAESAAQLERRFRQAGRYTPEVIEPQAQAHAVLFRTAARLHTTLIALWRARSEELAAEKIVARVEAKELVQGGARSNVPTPALFSLSFPEGVQVWVRTAEDFVAMRHTTFVYQALHSLRSTLSYCLLASLLLVTALNSYPFQPARTLNVFGWTLVVVVVGVGFAKIIGIERNELLSRLGGSEPEHINFNFNLVSQLFVYVVLPLGFALAGLFPEIGDGLFSVLAPLRRVLAQ